MTDCVICGRYKGPAESVTWPVFSCRCDYEKHILGEWQAQKKAEVEAAVMAEREACAVLVERGMGDWLLGKKVANAIRARIEE